MVNWLPDVSKVDRPGSSSASIAGLLTAKTGKGDGEVRHWVLSGGSYGPTRPLPRYLHLAAHCQSDKSGHVVKIMFYDKHPLLLEKYYLATLNIGQHTEISSGHWDSSEQQSVNIEVCACSCSGI